MKKGKEKKTAKAKISAVVMNGPIVVWSILFILIPVGVLVVMSFMTKGPLGIIVYRPTLANYKEILNPVYGNVVRQSLVIALWTTLLTVLLGYPFAAVMSKMRAKYSGIVMILLMIPMWVSGLVIIYSFVILFNQSGLINTLLLKIGLIHHPLKMLYTNFSVITGMLYMFMPFAILPMYTSIEKLDPALIEASKDLGAGPVRTFFKVTLPLTSPGIFAAVILTFIPCIGYYMVTDMLGGGTSMMAGNLIYRQFTIASNWPFGAALAVILAVVILLMVVIYTRLGGSLDDLG
ncbi:MAG: ABC transporter permease [Pseudoramibacter sp.]